MKRNLLIVAIVVLVTVMAIAVSRDIKNEQGIQSQPAQQQLQEKTFSTQTDNQGEVSVEVTPKILKAGKEANFQVALTTHSVELNRDLGKVSKLIDDRGSEYLPVSWSGGSGGHHLSGNLLFPSISENIKSLELKISGVGGVERVFKWEL